MLTLRHCVRALVGLAIYTALLRPTVSIAEKVDDDKMHHLRSGANREWEEFAERAQGRELVVSFLGAANPTEQTLRLRQRDVKQMWRATLNGQALGTLVQDENEMVTFMAVPPGAVRDGDNALRVSCEGGPPDDVMLGEVALIPKSRAKALSEATLEVEVVDADRGDHIPCRITIADSRGGLMSLGTSSGPTLAVRLGVVYSANGRVTIALPAGRYTVYAGRGFEYSTASAEVELKVGEAVQRKLSICRVVDTSGYVSCDTHVHTLTYSRHGDATAEERMATIAGEGIELPVATEHNLQINYAAIADKMGVRAHFTPLIGNEVTTPSLGHFNVFPLPPGGKIINWRGRDWDVLAASIKEAAADPVVVLNHGRDIHGGFRPFDPSRHISVAGESLDGRTLPANAMEVINSGATLADPMSLYRDWFGLLNRGHRITPIGASDSHDVSRYIVGQGRTYVRCDDATPGRIDVEQAHRSLREGRVSVSYGLLAEITVAGAFGPGDVAPLAGDLDVEVRVLGPEWSRASSVTLYANGVEVRRAEIPPPGERGEPAGVKWRGAWKLPRPKHDVHLVAIARGPGITKPYWPVAKPYQPTSPRWENYVLGSTGAVFVDADGSGRFDSAFDYATKLVREVNGDPDAAARKLADFDEAVAAQTASVLRQTMGGEFERTCERISATAAPAARRGIEAYLLEWKQSGATASGNANP